MSAIAGIIHFDGRPVEPGQIEAMIAAMHRRGPDGADHWRRGPVALGQCMLRTTPESLAETQPLANEDQSCVLVMDGRVDNADELRRELLGRGALLRTRSDAELVLRAWEAWGEDCVQHIIGECVFFIWDALQQRFFGARDAAGTRHFYFTLFKDGFAFASEIKGLLALPQVGRTLNENRLLDYLVEAFDRDDEIGTFYQGIERLPAGHAMRIQGGGAQAVGMQSWRWWKPGELPALTFSSLDECAEAFMDQLRVTVKCRLRSIRPVGAMLSGGLDSSAIVGLISKEMRGELREPLRTVSLIRDDRENCPDWRNIQQILQADPWLQPTLVTSAKVDAIWQRHLDSIAQADEPFSVFNGLTYDLTYAAGHEAGCGVVLDGMAGDVLFYGLDRTATLAAQSWNLAQVRAVFDAYHAHGFPGPWREMLAALPMARAPKPLRALVRRVRDARALRQGDLARLRPEVATAYLASKRSAAWGAGERDGPQNDQQAHARNFTTGLISFAHEVYGPLALNQGVEPRSPMSDRRMIEFAICMPLAAKLALPRYKQLLRTGAAGLLPPAVLDRRDIGGHPGWTFFDRIGAHVETDMPRQPKLANLHKWIGNEVLSGGSRGRSESDRPYTSAKRRYDLMRAVTLAIWLADGPLGESAP